MYTMLYLKCSSKYVVWDKSTSKKYSNQKVTIWHIMSKTWLWYDWYNSTALKSYHKNVKNKGNLNTDINTYKYKLTTMKTHTQNLRYRHYDKLVE